MIIIHPNFRPIPRKRLLSVHAITMMVLFSISAWSEVQTSDHGFSGNVCRGQIPTPYDQYPEASPPYYRVRFEPSTAPGKLTFGANFTAWVPEVPGPIRGVIVHQHGCGEGSCKSGLTGAYDLHWQALAKKHSCILISPAYEQPEKADCQLWCDPRKGSAEAFINALSEFARLTNHPEISSVPWALWGHSGGGHWCGGMAMMYPERVAAAWLRSGVPRVEPLGAQGNIASHPFAQAALRVPIMCNVGTKEGVSVQDDRFASVWPATLEFFHNIRSRGGLVATSVDPLTSHECGNQRYLAIPWFDECLTMRLPPAVNQPLIDIPSNRGWLAPSGGQAPVSSDSAPSNDETLTWSWLPSERFAKQWTLYSKDSTVPDDSPPPSPTDAWLEVDAIKGTVLRWKCEADLESGLAQFVIVRDGEVIARIPEKQNNPFGRSLFQGLQYSDTPPQPLMKMEFVDAKSRSDQTETTNPQTAKRYVYRIHAINTIGKPSEKTQFVQSQSTP